MAEYFPIDVSSIGSYSGSFSGSFYGYLFGTANYAVSAGYAVSAAYAPGGGGTPGGANTNIQFNRLGSFGGDSNFKYASASALVTINGDLSVTNKIDTTNRTLIDSTAITSVDWLSRYAIDSSTNVSIDWENRTLLDAAGNVSMDWESRYLYSVDGNYAFGFDNEIFTYSDFYHASAKPKSGVQEGFSSDSSSFAGDIIEANLNNTVAISNLVYLESDGKWYKVNQGSTSSTQMLGICVIVSKPGNGSVLLEGHVTVNDNDNGVGPYVEGVGYGLPIYIKSGSAAMMSAIEPTTGYVRLLGHAYYNNTSETHQWIMKFKPDNTWAKI
jgi:hypothetical protein